MTMAVVLALTPLRGQERRRRSSSRSLSSRERSRSSDRLRSRIACALVLGETGLAETALAVTGRCLLTATDHVDSVRVPPLAGELAVALSPASAS